MMLRPIWYRLAWKGSMGRLHQGLLLWTNCTEWPADRFSKLRA